MAKPDKQPMAIDLPDVVRLVEGGMVCATIDLYQNISNL
jgi:hypothetical protein